MMKKLLAFYRAYILEIWFTAAFSGLVLLMRLLNIPCFFKAITGIHCISCGLTRAVLSMLSGDFSAAFYYHPLFWSVPIIWLVFFFHKKFSAKALVVFSAVVFAAFAAVYIARMFFIPGSLIYIK